MYLFIALPQLEGRKTSASHFLKVVATLRPWELCYPEIAAAVEVRRI